jgi:hypothetical protein
MLDGGMTGTGRMSGLCGTHAWKWNWALVQIEENFNPINSTTFVLFGKYCPIMNQLGSKDSSRDFQLNRVISYFFTYI